VKKGLSVREVERAVRNARKTADASDSGEASPAGDGEADIYGDIPGGGPAVRRVTEELTRLFGTRVRVVPSGRRGKIEIDYASAAELDRLITLLKD
jgi:ParB-like chromosome segregation protein Spo0J